MHRCADWPEKDGTSDDTRRRPSNDQRHRLTSSVELIQSPHYEFGLLRGGVARHQLSTSVDPLYRTAWARLNAFWPSAFIDRLPEGIDRVRRHRHFALIVDSPTAEYVTTRRPCDLYATEPFLDVVAYGFAIGRRVAGADELRAGINRQLARLRRDSVLQTLYLHWWRSECNHVVSADKSPATRRRTNHSAVLDRGRHRGRHTDTTLHRAVGGGQRQNTALSAASAVVLSAFLVNYSTVL